VEASVLVVGAGCLVAYSLLAFLGAYVEAPLSPLVGCSPMVQTEVRDEESVRIQSAERTPRTWVRFLAVVSIALFVYVLSPVVQNGDSYLAVPTGWAVLHEGTISLGSLGNHVAVGHNAVVRTADGTTLEFQPLTQQDADRVLDRGGARVYDFFPWATGLFTVPVLAAVDASGHVFHTPSARTLIEHNDMAYLQLVSASLIVSLAAGVIFLLAWTFLSAVATRRRTVASVVVALAFAFGTSAWSTASRAMWQSAPSVLLVSLALLCVVHLRLADRPSPSRRTWLLVALGASLAGAYCVRPTNFVLLVLLMLWAVVTFRRRAVALIVGGLMVAVPFVVVNLNAFGSLLPPYFSGSRFGVQSAFASAVAADAISPSRGLLVFSPIVLVSVAGAVIALRRDRRDWLYWILLADVVLHWGLVAAWNKGWWAGHAYGPRFFVDVIPVFTLLAMPFVKYLAVRWAGPSWGPRQSFLLIGAAVLLAWSCFTNSQGAVFHASECWNDTPRNVDTDPGHVWDITDPQFTRGLRVLMSTHSLKEAVTEHCPGAPSP
jgi:hypothetical protein